MRTLDDTRNKSNIFNSSNIEKPQSRYCQRCNLKLVQRINEPHVYSCPQCNVTSNLVDTYPNPSLRLTFPTIDPSVPSNQRAKVLQNEDQRLPRSELYQKRRRQERESEGEANDLMLKKLRANTQLTITDIFYNDQDF